MKVSVKGGISPGEILLDHQRFEPTDGRLGEVRSMRSVVRVAKINPATDRPGFPRGASTPLVLPRAGRAVVERADRGRSVGDQDCEFGGGHE